MLHVPLSVQNIFTYSPNFMIILLCCMIMGILPQVSSAYLVKEARKSAVKYNAPQKLLKSSPTVYTMFYT